MNILDKNIVGFLSIALKQLLQRSLIYPVIINAVFG